MIPKKKPPYDRTEIDVIKSQNDIQKLLLEYGAEGIQWIVFRDALPRLAFIIEADINGIRKKVGVQIDPSITRPKNSPQGINYKQSMRLLYWYVKSKLEAVAYGVKTFEKEFLDDIVYRLPDGREVKVGDLILKQIAEGKDINFKLLGDGK
ncbi:MAG: hypothetical protein V1854_03615 [Methanobacteriota archaeon]